MQNDVAPLAVIVAVGAAFTLTVVAADVALHPEAFVTSTVYDPAVVAVYVEAVPICVVPFFQM